MNDKITLIGIPNISLLILTIAVGSMLTMPMEVTAAPLAWCVGLTFIGYMGWNLQIIVLKQKSVLSIFPFRLRKCIIPFEDTTYIGFSGKKYKHYASSASFLMHFFYIRATIRSSSNQEISFTQIGIANFRQLTQRLPLKEKQSKALITLQKEQAGVNFMSIGDLFPAILPLFLLYITVEQANMSEIAMWISGAIVMLRIISQQVSYCRLLPHPWLKALQNQKQLLYLLVMICAASILFKIIKG